MKLSVTKASVIAVNMSFDYPDPSKAQAVMQSYVTQFLRMDSDQVEDQANLTVRYLGEQAMKLRSQIQTLEGQITSLKASNGAALAGAGGPTFVDTGSYTAQITNLENQNRQLIAQSRAAGHELFAHGKAGSRDLVAHLGGAGGNVVGK